MPEIWLNYGITDVVLDIRAENLEQKIETEGKILEDSAIIEKLNSLDGITCHNQNTKFLKIKSRNYPAFFILSQRLFWLQ